MDGAMQNDALPLKLVSDNARLRREVAFRQADVTCAARGAVAAGLCVSSIKIGPDGVIEILTTRPRLN